MNVDRDAAGSIENIRSGLYEILEIYKGSSKKISETSSIWDDLNIGGDDVDELLEEIHGKFGTIFSGLNCNEYFPCEPDALIELIVRRIFGYRIKRKIMTVGHLVAVIQRGAWFEPEQPTAK